MPQLIKAINEAANEYEREYRPQYERLKAEAADAKLQRAQEQLERVKLDSKGEKVEDLITIGGPNIDVDYNEYLMSEGAADDVVPDEEMEGDK